MPYSISASRSRESPLSKAALLAMIICSSCLALLRAVQCFPALIEARQGRRIAGISIIPSRQEAER